MKFHGDGCRKAPTGRKHPFPLPHFLQRKLRGQAVAIRADPPSNCVAPRCLRMESGIRMLLCSSGEMYLFSWNRITSGTKFFLPVKDTKSVAVSPFLKKGKKG